MNTLSSPPYSPEAEADVIGCVAQDSATAFKYIDKTNIVPEWFFVTDNRVIWNAIVDMRRKRLPIDPVTISTFITEHGMNGSSSMYEYIKKCCDAVTTMAHLGYYLNIIRSKHVKRCIIKLTNDIQKTCYSEAEPSDIIIEAKHELSTLKTEDNNQVTPAMMIDNITSQFVQAAQSGFIGVPSRFASIRNSIGGYTYGKQHILGSRPKIGKTTYALNEIRHAVQHSGIPSGIVELEMSEEELRAKMVADELGIDLDRLRKGKGTSLEIDAFTEAGQRQAKLPMYVLSGSRTITQICAWIRDHKEDIRFCVVDYLQMISRDPRDPKSEREMYANWSHELTSTANDTNVAILSVCQLNREAEYDKNNKRILPQARHLKGTGDLEQDGYTVTLLGRSLSLEGDEEWNDAQPTVVKIAYNRGGPTGQFDFEFMKRQNRFRELGEEVPEQNGNPF